MAIRGSESQERTCLGIPVVEQIAHRQRRISTKVAKVAKVGHLSLLPSHRLSDSSSSSSNGTGCCGASALAGGGGRKRDLSASNEIDQLLLTRALWMGDRQGRLIRVATLHPYSVRPFLCPAIRSTPALAK
jgi:hypothetical protein